MNKTIEEIVKTSVKRFEFVLPCLIGEIEGDVVDEITYMKGDEIGDLGFQKGICIHFQYSDLVKGEAFCLISAKDVRRIVKLMMNMDAVDEGEEICEPLTNLECEAVCEFVRLSMLGPDISLFSELAEKEVDGEITGFELVDFSSGDWIDKLGIAPAEEYLVERISYDTKRVKGIQMYRGYRG